MTNLQDMQYEEETKKILYGKESSSGYNDLQNGRENNFASGLQEKPNGRADGNGDLAAMDRERWGGKLDFLLSCVAFAVGLGNVWRFPYLCYKNGGGAFLIPYFICAILGGIPLFFMEAALGQYTSLGGIKAWAICPLFQGIGAATTMIAFWCNVYYIVVLTWAIYYLYSSFTAELPWAHCGHSWNTEFCTENDFNITCVNETEVENGTVVIREMVAGSNYTCDDFKPTTAVQEFWENNVLQLSTGLDDMNNVVGHLAICLLVAWISCYFCIWKGVKWTGKVVYFTSTFPYVVLTILVIRGVTLPGAVDGLLFYFKPDLSRLSDGRVWIDSGTQIFYSYAIGLGACVAMGSYNKFHHNVYRDSMILAGVNSFTSIYGGIAIFSVLGHMSYEQNRPISEIVSSGPGLAFIAYPQALALMPLAPLWSVLFFIMILMVGLDSQFVAVEGFVTAIGDLFPIWMKRPLRRELLVLAVCIVSYIIGLSMVTDGGIYLFQIFDSYAVSGIALLWVAFCEGITIGWFYGANKFYENVAEMLGWRPFPWFKYCWIFTLPGITMAIWLFSVATWSPLTYDDYVYPPWAEALGFILALSSMVCIPLGMLYQIYGAEGSLVERMKFLIQPAVKPVRENEEREDLELDHY